MSHNREDLQSTHDRAARIGGILGDLQRMAELCAQHGDQMEMGSALEACRSMSWEAMLIAEDIEISELRKMVPQETTTETTA